MDKKTINITIPIIFCTIVTLLISFWYKEKILVFDTADYWRRGESLFQGGFSLYNIPDTFRGYLFPLYLGIAGKLGGINGYKIINAIIVGMLFGYIFPKLFLSTDERRKGIKTIICYLLFLMLHRGVIVYPLSDFFAAALCACSIVACNSFLKNDSRLKNAAKAFICGALCYAAYNVRTIYLFVGIYTIGKLIICIIRDKHSLLSKIAYTFWALLGGAVAGLPQLLLNIHFEERFSFSVPTSGLMRMQLFWGIQYQRYDTFVGSMAEHPNPQMYFIDSVGQALIEREGITGFASWLDFIKFILKYPIEVGGIYIRHFINILLPCWPNQYVQDMDNNKVFLAIISLVITFLFLIVIFGNMSHSTSVYKNFMPLLIPAVFILPGAVEVRFFIMVYMLIIYTLAFNTEWRKLFSYLRLYWGRVAILFVLYSGVICSIWSTLLVSEISYKIFMY